MTDREKVIKGLEHCIADNCDLCPYDENVDCPGFDPTPKTLLADVLALLKAQEPVVMAGAELTDAELIDAIRKAPITLKPAVDAVPVVRCAYCKHCFDLSTDPMEPYDGESEWYCERFDRDTSAYEIDPYSFFCADGEWRDEDAAD